ncbi:hypothetical protein GOV12_02835 [Candidatus Pacearchaeota archaeon]|nr:hypothetical protein [Candidatus Pacearchaeota archaeon]
MKKEVKRDVKINQKIITIIILLSLIGVFTIFYSNKPSESTNLTQYAIKEFDQNESDLQIYKNMRFNKRLISFNIDNTCNDFQKNRINNSFNIITNETRTLWFYNVTKNEDIFITCNESENISEGYVKVGEGGAYSVIYTGDYHVINKGKITLFNKSEFCDYPNTIMHELLHVFGFKHLVNNNSIMHNVSNCNQKLDSNIIKELIKLYNIQEVPDLSFEDVNFQKNSRYLNFEAVVLNRGLREGNNITLDVSLSNKKIKIIDLGSIKPGEGKTIKVENLFINNNKKINLILQTKRDINLNNNLLEIIL